MNKERIFKRVEYETHVEQQIRLGDFVLANHLACFIVRVISEIDVSGFYRQYSASGGAAYAPEVLLGLWLYSLSNSIKPKR